MAEFENRYPENVPGRFYVDVSCIDCDVCRNTAPTVFTRNDEGRFSYVYKQPETSEEIADCLEATEGCPTDSIGADGEG